MDAAIAIDIRVHLIGPPPLCQVVRTEARYEQTSENKDQGRPYTSDILVAAGGSFLHVFV